MYQPTTELSNQRNRAGLPIEDTVRILSVSREKAQQYENGQISVPDLETIFLRAHADNIVAQRNGGTFRFIGLFAGIGGMRKGFEAAGGRCVFYK